MTLGQDAGFLAATYGAFALGWMLCSRTQANRMNDALAVAKIATSSVGSVMESTARLASEVEGAKLLATEVATLTAEQRKLREVVESLDRGQGSILNVMVNSGLIGGLGGRRDPEPQTGETYLSRARRHSGVDEVPIPPAKERPADAAR